MPRGLKIFRLLSALHLSRLYRGTPNPDHHLVRACLVVFHRLACERAVTGNGWVSRDLLQEVCGSFEVELREFNGEKYVMETGLFADISIVHAWKGDTEGNLVYRKTARNFNPLMATASRLIPG